MIFWFPLLEQWYGIDTFIKDTMYSLVNWLRVKSNNFIFFPNENVELDINNRKNMIEKDDW